LGSQGENLSLARATGGKILLAQKLMPNVGCMALNGDFSGMFKSLTAQSTKK